MAVKKNIALLMAIMENEFSSAVMYGALKGAHDHDVNLIVFPMDLLGARYSNNEVNEYRYQYNILASHMTSESIDGIIVEYGTICSALPEEEKRTFLKCLGKKPTVLLSDHAEGYKSICVNNRSGLEEVIEHLIVDHGCRKIGYLSGMKGNTDAEERLDVYKEVMRRHNLPFSDEIIAYGNFSEYVDEVVEDLIRRNPNLDAIVCANDDMANGTARVMRNLGIELGKDMLLTGFDDIAAGFLLEPALTTVMANPGDLAYRAMECLCAGDVGPGVETVDTRMVRRASCGCCDYAPDGKWKEMLQISGDWRQSAIIKFRDEAEHRSLEHELGNVTREMVFARDTEKERYESILNTIRRLEFKSCRIFMYDEFISHTRNEIWNNPDHLNLVAYYSDVDRMHNHVYNNGSKPIPCTDIFYHVMPQDDNRHDVVAVPLFFGARQIGLLIVESEPRRFLCAQDMAGQISNTLFIIYMNEEQKRMQKALEEASLAKSRFLANMSHEIRTPINAIIGFNEMILRENHDENISGYARDVKSAADALLVLVNDVLDFSKIEAGKMDLVPVNYSLGNLITGVVEMMTARAEKKGLAIYVDCDRTLPNGLFGDSNRIQQILLNLMSNAVKYTEKGTVTLAVSGVVDGDYLRLHIEVKDTGIGIREEDLGRLFNEFERVDEKRNRNIEGTGLGISITTKLLNLMGSQLQVSSTYGTGSVFYFDLEQKIIDRTAIGDGGREVEKSVEEEEIHFTAPSARILVVDDNRMNRRVIVSLMKETEIEIDQAESGRQCIEMVAEQEYDLILLDHMMPEMDGMETLEKLLDEHWIDIRRTPVVALTANAIVGAREEYLEKGFTDYLSKPVLLKDLYAMVVKLLPAEKVNRVTAE